MTQENDNLDNIRRAWISMGESLGYNTTDFSTKKFNNMKTTLDRLADKYKMFVIISIVMILTSSFTLSRPEILASPWNIYLPIAYSIYFFITFAIDFYLYSGVKSIDALTMSVSEVAHKALYYRKRHLQSIMILLPMAVVIIIFTARAFAFAPDVLTGIIAGALVGLAIGITQLCRFLRYYRKLSE